jgi:extracellular factor (EF) 3-hydroxypalmitic acid methyl ester biosynthesis protein
MNGNGNGNSHAGLQAFIKPAKKPAVISPLTDAAQESRIVFNATDGTKVSGSLLRLTRLAVIFELYSPDSGLRLSEVVEEFKVTVREKVVYSGRAHINNIVDTATKIICEATLEEAGWVVTAAGWSSAPEGYIGREFKAFTQEWQKLYQIRPEYKLVLADMQTYLTDLRLWLDQLELDIHSLPETRRLARERAIIAEIGQIAFPAFAALFEQFEEAARKVDRQFLPAHQLLVKRQIHSLLMCSPFMHRIYAKPLGYAGDYEMVNMILRDPHEGGSLFAKLLNVFILGTVPGEAHRNRVVYLLQRLVEETNRMVQRKEPCRIYNLGCGPAGEVQRFLTLHKVSDHARFTLLDADEETLRNTGTLLESLKARHHRRTPIKLVKKSVHQLIRASERKKSAEEQYDFVYSAGLYDYLTDQVGRMIINLGYDLLAPGGLLLITNVDPVNPIRNIMEHIYDWHLIYRNGAELGALASDLPAGAQINVQAEITGANVILEVRKPR